MSLIPESPDSSSNSGVIHRQTPSAAPPSRYESQKRRDWNTFGQYLKNHRPPLTLSRCSGAHVLEFLRYLDQFGKTKVHAAGCPFFGNPHPPAPCPCPLRQAWGSLDALIGRLRAAFEENGGLPEANPFGARAVRLYLRDVRDSQAKARGVSYEKKKRKRPPPPPPQQPPPPPPLPLPPQHPPQLLQQVQTQYDMIGGGGGGGEDAVMMNGIYNNHPHPHPQPHHVFLHGHVFLTSGGDVDGGLIPLSVQY